VRIDEDNACPSQYNGLHGANDFLPGQIDFDGIKKENSFPLFLF
jgi:hypothetical protein